MKLKMLPLLFALTLTTGSCSMFGCKKCCKSKESQTCKKCGDSNCKDGKCKVKKKA